MKINFFIYRSSAVTFWGAKFVSSSCPFPVRQPLAVMRMLICLVAAFSKQASQ